jgi:DNA-binding response OmpR family regulator
MKRALLFLVQDSATLSLQLQRWLHSLGYAVKLAAVRDVENVCSPSPVLGCLESGYLESSCVDLACVDLSCVDLVCVEVWGATGNGFKVLRQLDTYYQGPRVLLTGSGRSSDHAWGQRVGASAVLARPFGYEQLAACVGGLP